MSCNWFPTKVYCFHECLLTRFWLFALNISECTNTERQETRYPGARTSASPPETFTQQLNTPGTVTILQGVIALGINMSASLRWRHNDRDSVSNHQPHNCLLNRLFRRRPKKTSKLPVTGLCAGNSSGTGEFPAQMASNAENISIWWRHHVAIELSVGFNP